MDRLNSHGNPKARSKAYKTNLFDFNPTEQHGIISAPHSIACCFSGNDSAVEAVTKKELPRAPSASLEPLAHSATVSRSGSSWHAFRELTLPPVALGKLSLKEA